MDRYYVKESTGYLIRPGMLTAGNARTMTEVLVLDRDLCHNVVWSSFNRVPNARKNGNTHNRMFTQLRAEAHSIAAQWNEEDRVDVG